VSKKEKIGFEAYSAAKARRRELARLQRRAEKTLERVTSENLTGKKATEATV